MRPPPRVLIATWYRWPSAARMAAALIAGGVHVDVVCPDFHPIQTLKGLSERFRFAISSPSRSLARAIERSKPAIIIPCDDFALGELNRLRQRATPSTAALIERSLADGDYEALTSRASFVQAALEAGVPCPPTEATPDKAALRRWLDEHGAPAFVKLEGTFGGLGVRLAHDARSAGAAFDALARRPSAADAFKHLLTRQEFSKANSWLGRTPMTVSVQKSVPGVPANCSAFAWGGEVRAIVSVEVLRTVTEFGVATCVLPIENTSMDAAARAVARRFGITGVFGLDFILERPTGRTWLIEINPRPTQISHLNFGPGRDLVAALVGAISDGPEPVRARLPMGVPIALFPHCLRCDPRSGEVFEDLPFDQPGLIRAFTPLNERLSWTRLRRQSRKTCPAPVGEGLRASWD